MEKTPLPGFLVPVLGLAINIAIGQVVDLSGTRDGYAATRDGTEVR